MTLPRQLGRYEIIETLGRGAMGVVYKAHDPLIERTVAIKTISYAGLSHAEVQDFEQRFFLEAKSAGRLNHPNIVTIHDVGHSNDLAYIAMEFLSGQSLRDVLDSGVVLPAKRIAKIAYSVANGLAFAHSNGVIHRDIKPANIMVLDNGLVKIADFGIALLPSGSQTMAGTAVGSPKYISPEQVLGQKADARSDIFSLGAVLYEMLTGHPPFAGEDLNAILYQVLNTAPPLPSSVNAGLPPGFDRIVARALAKDPDKRYQRAIEMAADLRNYKQVRGMLHNDAKPAAAASGSARSKPAQPVAGRHKRWLGLAAAGLAVLGVAVYLGSASSPAPAPATLTPAAETPATPAPVVDNTPPPAAAPVPATPPAAAPADPAPKPAASDTKPAAPAKPAKAKPASREPEKPKSPPAAESKPAEESKPALDWKKKLRAELDECKPLSFFSRLACQDRAMWKYCPGHWGTISDCPQAPQSEP